MFIVLVLHTPTTKAVSVTHEELSEASRWAAAKFEGKPETKPAEGYVMAYLRSGGLERNTNKGHRLRIAGRVFEGGLHFPSVGRVTVHLPGPGKNFDAVAGVDSNDVDYYSNMGHGAVTCAVEVGDKEAFRSAVMTEGMPGVPVKVNLNGATEFTIVVGAAGGGSAWDQADWAEARVELDDGSTLFLADLPIGPMRALYSTEVPFSFRYGDQPSRELLKRWESKRSVRQVDEERTERTLTFTDPKTRLAVRCVSIEYHDFPTVEWTLYFKNTGNTPTPIIEDIQALDTRLERNGEGEFVLHHGAGALAKPPDYEPLETQFGVKAEQRIGAMGGKPTNSDLSYFNLEWPGHGVIIVVGWPGQWSAQFSRDEGNGLRVQAGQELTHFKLLPGEEVRTPLMVLQFWKGDWIRAQNIWRRWMIAHNVPRPGGKLPPPQFAAASSHAFQEMQNANEDNQKMFIDRYLAEGLKIDYWWMDAGWYPFREGWWNTGTWEPDPRRFPHGLRAVSDYAHAKGVKIIVWFEPERVQPGTWLYVKHPEWLIGPDGQQKLLNFGNPQARQWITDHVDQLINEQGIDLYRQDFNTEPLSYWRANDTAERQGITEIGYVSGYLAYWDQLRRRHPNMLIDSCAGGGRRNDLETMRRAVPLTRSDYLLEIEPGEPLSQQSQTYGIALWIPYFGTGINGRDAYTFRSQMCPAMTGTWDMRLKAIDYAPVRRLLGQWRTVANYFNGDYYPLTPYSLDKNVWLAWQFDRPDLGEGMVEAFRRSLTPYDSARFQLQGLEPDARYAVTDLDRATTIELTGFELMDHGLHVGLDNRPASAILVYKRIK
jgi:alpha-galactosidase